MYIESLFINNQYRSKDTSEIFILKFNVAFFQSVTACDAQIRSLD